MFQTGAHAVLSVTQSLRPASINYLVLKGLIVLLLKSTYNLLFVPKECLDIILENK